MNDEVTITTKPKRLALNEWRDAYRDLHDQVSDMVEGGRLTPADIPDDYEALVEAMARAVSAEHRLVLYYRKEKEER